MAAQTMSGMAPGRSVALRAFALLLAVLGAALAAGGIMLAWNGGSPYYLLAGAALIVSALLAWRRDRRAAAVYAALLLLTLAWAIYEIGFNVWGLLARLGLLCLLGLPFLFIRTGGVARATGPLTGRGVFLLAVPIALCLGLVLRAIGPAAPADPLWARGEAAIPQPSPVTGLAATERTDWQHYGNDQGGTRFSPLSQISTKNVKQLAVAWEADIGPARPGPRGTLEVTPINIGDALYVCNGNNVVLSLDAETGRERWRYDMTADVAPSGKPCRGVSYYRVPNATGVCAERIIATSQTPELFALDAATGLPCPGFGNNGRVRLLDGMGTVPVGYHYVSSAPLIIRGKAVFGGAVMDGQYWGEPPGVIRAFDLVTGKLAWAFDSGRPHEHQALEAGQHFTMATPNSWAPISADEQLGLIYLPTGNATPDFYGAQRRDFDDDNASSVIALDADTGERRWRFQTVHHDLWDYDVPSQPTLVDLPTASGVRHALVQPAKRGEIFVLDRATGEPIKEVTEVPVPQGGGAPGDRMSPTQPFSTGMPSFRGPTLREADMWGMTPVDQMVCRIQFRQSRYEGTLTPPTVGKPVIYDPGYGGGVNWGSVSVDTDRQLMLVNWMKVPMRVQLYPRDQAQAHDIHRFDGSTGQGGPRAPMDNTPYAALIKPFVSLLGIPCNVPPWSQLSAVDLQSGRTIWSRPLGTGRDSGPLGIRSHLPITMGVPGTGGSVTTRGGLVFIGFAIDSGFRAFDVASGAPLWQADLPGAGMATPMTYQSSRSGRQFVVIAAGGKADLKTRISTKIVAYALPQAAINPLPSSGVK